MNKVLATVFTVLIGSVIFLMGISLGVGAGKAVMMQREVKQVKLQNEIDGIYNLIEQSNETHAMILSSQYRIYHYIAGHKNDFPGCDECGLIKELEYRRQSLDRELADIASDIQRLDDGTPEHTALVDRVNALTVESDIVAQHVHNSTERAKAVSDFMKRRAAEKEKK
jgi:succinylglutamate desuccinylase